MDRKKALISGASSGIGKATAIRFAQEGYEVCLTARREKELLAVRDLLPPGEHLVCPGDYSDPDVVAQIAAQVQRAWGRLDALINCAGVFIPGHAVETPLDAWRRPLDIMVNGAVHLTRLAVPLMSHGGRIVHITSIHGERAEARASAYAMAKAALNQYCRCLAVELADWGILVNAIAPGFVDTPMSVIDGVNELETDWFRQNYVEGHHLPLRRPGRPEEIAGVAWFLAGPDASYITGQVITVDGGLTITF
ncbi:MAG: oxidoreductase [Litorilinea sp.]|nr:MAG: oxidoreductase [Litorilinea sp.]